MTDKELKKLKDTLWHSADVLRASAHLAANKYGQSILGLDMQIFYINSIRKRLKLRTIVLKADVWKNPSKKAMEAIEDENPKMDGVLPKEVYIQLVPEEE